MTLVDRTYSLRIVHISDLHIGQPGVEHEWRRRRVLGKAWEENLDVLRDSGKAVDLLCFTGDAVFNGKDHYDVASTFFEEVLHRLNLPPERFFAVPGNHDVDRNVNFSIWKSLRSKLPDLEPVKLSAWLTSGKTPRGFSAQTLDKVLGRSAAFWDWLGNGMKRPELLPAQSPHRKLGYRVSLEWPEWPFPIQVIGLDTAWLAGDEDDAGKLRLTDGQIGMLANEDLKGFKIALAHHPLDFLADTKDSRRLLAERVDIVLQGHLHEPDTELWSDPDRSLRENTAGCLYEHDRWPNSMHVIDVELDAAGQPLHYDLWVRSWSSRSSSWFDDNGLYKATKDGKLRRYTPLGEAARLRRLAEASLEALRRESRERIFIEREKEMGELVETLLSGPGTPSHCAITTVEGMPGVGKSYLASEFLIRNERHFPGGVWTLILARNDPRDARALALDLCEQLKAYPGANEPWPVLNERLTAAASLILIENVDTEALAREVAAFAHQLPRCPILVTGRYRGIGDNGRWHSVPLRPFAHGEAFDQLKQELREEAFPIFAGLSDEHSMAEIMGKIANILEQRGETDEALRVLREKVLPGFARLDDAYATAVTMGRIADILTQRGEIDEALRIRREEELPVYAHLSDMHSMAMTLGQIADILAQRGETDEALRVLREEVLPAFVRLDDANATAVTMGKIADILQQCGELDEVLRIRREEQLPVFARLGNERATAVTMGKIADILYWRGEYDEALRIRREEQLPVFARLGDVRETAVTMGGIADILLRRGETDEALRIRREEQLPVFARLGNVRETAMTMGKIADILLERGETDEALRVLLEEQLPIALEMNDWDSIAHIRFSCARIRLECDGLEKGEAQTISEELSESFDINKKLQRADGIAFVGDLFGQVLAATGQTELAVQTLAESAVAYEKLGRAQEAAEVRAFRARIVNNAEL